MKKVLFITLAIIMALGALGVGYASWTDKVNITGTVNTGTVSIEVLSYSGMWVWKTPGADAVYDPANPGSIGLIQDDQTITLANVAPPGAIDAFPFSGGALDPVAYANAAQGLTNKDIVVNFNNLFPIDMGPEATESPMPYTADFVIHNNGTVPVKVNLDNLAIVWTGRQPNGDIVTSITAALSTDGGATYTPVAVLGVQLEPSYRLEIMVNITVAEDGIIGGTGMNNADNQGLSGTITGTIGVIQWNEYP